jgi:ferredoxin
VCEPECPAEAIVSDSDPSAAPWSDLNRDYASQWPNITKKGDAPADADAWKGVPDKHAKYFSAKPGGGS